MIRSKFMSKVNYRAIFILFKNVFTRFWFIAFLVFISFSPALIISVIAFGILLWLFMDQIKTTEIQKMAWTIQGVFLLVLGGVLGIFNMSRFGIAFSRFVSTFNDSKHPIINTQNLY
jgi:hypothetical protein